MSDKPIEQSRDPDLRASHAALVRAAARARELARRTGTRLVIVRRGMVQYIAPDQVGAAEPELPYGNEI